MKEIEAMLRAGPDTADAEVDDAMDAFLALAERDGLVDVAWAEVDTPVGSIVVASTEIGLVRVGLLPDDPMLEQLAAEVSPRVIRSPKRLDPVRRQFDEYFEGDRTVFDVPVDWRLSHGFRRTVLETLYADVRFGQVVSYGELAKKVGHPKASRAVGTAMATNPVPIVVPCHRVVRTGGAIGNYGGGVEMKRALLRLEGALLT
jgi:methylated-DNA-[protein]-cysteine S-methyltransferase